MEKLARIYQETKALIQQHPHYYADELASALLESGVSFDEVMLSRRAGKQGGHSYDIESVAMTYPYVEPDHPYINIHTSSQGIYDNLPEDLFFSNPQSKGEQDRRQIISRMKANREVEQEVRRFFSLYEAELDAFKIAMRREELHYLKADKYDNLHALFTSYWEVAELMNRTELLRLLQLLPFVADLRGDYGKTAEAISYVLGAQVEIKIVWRPAECPDNDTNASPILGVDFTLGFSQARPEEVIQLSISGVKPELYPQFIEQQHYHRLVIMLAEMMIESTQKIALLLVCADDAREFYIGDAEQPAYFGLNTYL